LIADHLARVPPSPTKLKASVPQVFSKEIMRLLEKEPDRRWPSAFKIAIARKLYRRMTDKNSTIQQNRGWGRQHHP